MPINPIKRIAVASLAVASFSSSYAVPVTLDTSWMNANCTFTLSQAAINTLYLTQVSIVPSGTTTAVGSDAFNMPITQLSANISLLPPSVAPTSGIAKGAYIGFDDALTGKTVSLGNLSIDFKTNGIFADVTSNGTTLSQQRIFTFDVTQPLSFSLKGGVSVNETMGNLHMVDWAAQTFTSGLGLPSFFSSVLTTVDFGTIQAIISPTLRKSSLGAQAIASVQAVPEASTQALMGIGLLAMFLVSRRQASRSV